MISLLLTVGDENDRGGSVVRFDTMGPRRVKLNVNREIELKYVEKPLPIYKNDFYPATYLYNLQSESKFIQTIENVIKSKETSMLDDPSSNIPHHIQVRNTQFGPEQWSDIPFYTSVPVEVDILKEVEHLQQKQKIKPDKQLILKKSPFLPITLQNNKFVFARSMLHPCLEYYNFADIGVLISVIWSDYTTSSASDYYTFLSTCCQVTPENLHTQMQFLPIWESQRPAFLTRPFEEILKESVELRRQNKPLFID